MSSTIIVQKILDSYSSFSNTDKRIADYVMANQALIPYKTLAQVAAETSSSEPSVMRFIKKMQISSFVEFKRVLLLADLNLKAKADNQNSFVTDQSCMVKEKNPYEHIPQMVIDKFIEGLSNVLQMSNTASLENAVKAITTANTINIYGVGYSGTIAVDLMYRFVKIGLDCRAYCEEIWQHIVKPNITDKDTAIGISYSGESLSVIRAMRYAKEVGASTIAITGTLGSKLTEFADITFYAPKVEPEWAAYSMLTSITHIAICDMLFLGVLNSNWNKYSKEWEKFSTMTADSYSSTDNKTK